VCDFIWIIYAENVGGKMKYLPLKLFHVFFVELGFYIRLEPKKFFATKLDKVNKESKFPWNLFYKYYKFIFDKNSLFKR
jgi:hypothetical protein